MNIHEWVAYEMKATGATAFEFFDKCYREIYTTSCRSNTVKLHAEKYEKNKLVPGNCEYVWRCFDKMSASKWTLPANAERRV